jgi:hypothetical protein
MGLLACTGARQSARGLAQSKTLARPSECPLTTLRQTLPRDAWEPPRSTLDPDQGYYGEAPVGLRRYGRAVGDAGFPHYPGDRSKLLIMRGIHF